MIVVGRYIGTAEVY